MLNKENQNKKILFKILKVKGDSMSPLINNNEFIVVSIIPYLLQKPTINDIVVLIHPSKNIKIIKRISQINKKKYFVIGDNSENSTDSRNFGFISHDLILAKVLFR